MRCKMKNLYALTFFCLLFVQFSFGQGVFNSAASGAWNSAGSWTLVSGSDADGIPDSDDDVTILNGHVIDLSESANAKNVTINSGGRIIGPNAASTIYYLRIYGSSLINNGTLGGADAGTRLGLEPANSGGTVTLSGSGTCIISQVRPQSAALNMGFVIDQDMTVIRTWGRGLGFTGYQSTTSIGNTIIINSGRTVTLDSTADFHHGSTSALPSTGGNTTYIINGTLKTNAGQRFILIPFNSGTSALTLEVNGLIDLGGRVFGQRVSGQTSAGPVNLNINNGGVVKVSGVPAEPTMDLIDVNTILIGTGYLDAGSWTFTYAPTNYIKTTGTGGLKRNVGSTNVTFPVGTATTYNPLVMRNTGTLDKFTVRVKATFDNPPIDANKVVNRQWTIDEEVVGGSNATISLQWNLAEEASGFIRNVDLLISRYTGTIWSGRGASLSGTNPYIATASGFTELSNFIVESRPISTFQLSSSNINFGTVEVTKSKTDSIYIRNKGAVTLNVSSILSDNPLFTVNVANVSIPVNDSAKIKITFSPTGGGSATGNIIFTHDGGASPHLASVTGTGVFPDPVFSVNPTNLTFGTVGIGRTKLDSVVVTNIGGQNLIINLVSSFHSNFTVNPIGPVTILPAATQKFYVTFAPTTETVLSGNLNFFNNTPTSPNAVGLTGTGLIMKTVLSNGTGGGNWASTSTWQGGNLPSIVDSVVILGTDSVHLLSDVSTGGLGVQTGGRLLLLDTLRVINSTVSGTIIASGTSNASAVFPSGTMTFLNDALYTHALPNGVIPTATWSTGSTCLLTGVTNATAGMNANQNFYNFIVNCPNWSGNLNFGWGGTSTSAPITIGGDVIIISTGNGRWNWCAPLSGVSVTVNVEGNIIVNGSATTSTNLASVTATGTGNGNTNITINVAGNVVVTGNPSNNSWTNFSLSRGSQSGSGTTTWNFYGNVSVSNAQIQNSTTTTSGGLGKFVFAKNGEQSLTLSNLNSSSAPINIEVNSGSILNIGSSTLTPSSGFFTLSSGAGIITSHASGLNGNLTNTGDKNLSTSANYNFNGTSAQVTGALMPTTVNNLTINNTAGVALSTSTTVNGIISILNGSVTTGANTITLGSSAVLSESAGKTVIGKIVTTRNVLQGVNNTFGGIGIEINATGAAPGSTVVERVTGVAQTGNGKSSILRYFNINPTVNTGLNSSFVFKYDNTELAGQTASTLQLYISTNVGVSWIARGGTTNVAERTITLSGVNSFSRWTAADANNPIGVATLTLTAMIEGFIRNSTTMIADNVTVELRNANTPYSLVELKTVALNASGIGIGGFALAQNGVPYWIVVKHRNSVETWSSAIQTFTDETLSYNFTTSATQAYGDNMKVKFGKWCIFSGDVNQSGGVDLSDVATVDVDNNNFVTGYVVTDVTGDNVVDITDLAITDVNNNNFVSAIKPQTMKTKEVKPVEPKVEVE